jgi:hypothetical protein
MLYLLYSSQTWILFLGLFNDAVNSFDCVVSNENMMIMKGGMGMRLNISRYYPRIFLEGMRKITLNHSNDRWSN